MLSVPTGSTTVLQISDPFVPRARLLSTGSTGVRVILCSRRGAAPRSGRLRSGGRLRQSRAYQLPFVQTAQPAVDFRIGEVLTGLPAADQKPPDGASRSVPPTPEETGSRS
jgi:hypothetical protein